MRIEHQYPEALTFLRHHGPQALAVLHDLLAAAQPRNGGWVVQTSNREVARRLEFISKDTVNRRHPGQPWHPQGDAGAVRLRGGGR